MSDRLHSIYGWTKQGYDITDIDKVYILPIPEEFLNISNSGITNIENFLGTEDRYSFTNEDILKGLGIPDDQLSNDLSEV